METYLPPISETGRRWLRFAALLAAVGVLCWILLSLRAVFTPILAALAIAYVLNPVVSRLEQRGANRLLVVTGLYFVGTVLVLALGLFVVTTLVAQAVELREHLDEYLRTIYRWLAVRAEQQDGIRPAELWWREVAPLVQQHGVQAADFLLVFLVGLLSNTLNLLTLFVLLPMYSFFFLWKYDGVVRTIHDHLPAASRAAVVHVARTIDAAVARFFRGRLIVCFVVGLATGYGWTLVGVPFGLALGALAGVLNLVPFMSLLALPVALVAVYIDAAGADVNWVGPVLLTMAVYVVVQALESFVLTPLIESRSAGLHPITTVVALMIGGQWAGLLGMLLAIPVASTLKTLAAEFVLPEVRRLAGQPVPASGGAGEPAPEPAAEEEPRAEVR